MGVRGSKGIGMLEVGALVVVRDCGGNVGLTLSASVGF